MTAQPHDHVHAQPGPLGLDALVALADLIAALAGQALTPDESSRLKAAYQACSASDDGPTLAAMAQYLRRTAPPSRSDRAGEGGQSTTCPPTGRRCTPGGCECRQPRRGGIVTDHQDHAHTPMTDIVDRAEYAIEHGSSDKLHADLLAEVKRLRES